MERKHQMKFRVSKEEKRIIETNTKKAGFASTASYMRNQCLNSQRQALYLYQKCEIRDSLQKIDELAGSDSRVSCHIQNIHNILDKAGDE